MRSDSFGNETISRQVPLALITEISYCYSSALVPWKKEHLQGTINIKDRKGWGNYTKPKGSAIQHDLHCGMVDCVVCVIDQKEGVFSM